MPQLSDEQLSTCIRKIRASNPWPMQDITLDEISGILLAVDQQVAIQAVSQYELCENPPKNVVAAIRGNIRELISQQQQNEVNSFGNQKWRYTDVDCATYEDYHLETLKVNAILSRNGINIVNAESFETRSKRYLDAYNKQKGEVPF